MKKVLLAISLAAMAFATALPACADSTDDPHLQVGPCSGGFPNCSGDPNLISGNSVELFDQGSQSGNGSGQPVGPIALILVVPTADGPYNIPTGVTLSSGTGTLGGSNFLGGHWNTTTGLVSTTADTSLSQDLITGYIGFDDTGDGSNNVTNFNGEEASLGFPTGSYDAFVYSLTNTGLSGPSNNPLTITFNENLSKGTIVLAYSCINNDISGTACNNGGTAFVPWTTAGFVNQSTVPEPGSLLLFGTGLTGLAAFLRKQRNAKAS